MIDAAISDDFADVDETFHSFGDLNKGAEVHDLGDGAFDLRAGRKSALNFKPGVGECLLEAERDAALLRARGRFDRENDSINALALAEQVRGMTNFLRPRHLRNVNEALEAGLELDECAEVG